MKNRLQNSVQLATKNVATVVNRAVAATIVVMKNANLVKNVLPARSVPNAHRVKSVHLANNAHRVKNVPSANLVKPVKTRHLAKSVRPVLPVSASRVKLVKTARFVNCASLWTQPRLLIWPAKNVLNALRVKSVNHASLVKNVNHAPNRPRRLHPKKSKYCSTTNRPTTRIRTATTAVKATALAAAPVVSVVAATVASVNVMPTAM